jgi:hypothetical protein
MACRQCVGPAAEDMGEITGDARQEFVGTDKKRFRAICTRTVFKQTGGNKLA